MPFVPAVARLVSMLGQCQRVSAQLHVFSVFQLPMGNVLPSELIGNRARKIKFTSSERAEKVRHSQTLSSLSLAWTFQTVQCNKVHP